MENVMVRTEVKQDNMIKDTSKLKFREILCLVLNSNPVVKSIRIVSMDDSFDGIMSFDVPLESIGLDAQLLKKYHNEIFTNRFVNIIAEIILRENINKFAEEMLKINVTSYSEALSMKKHENFGMKVKGGNLSFDFHVSFLQDIIMSDFRDQIK